MIRLLKKGGIAAGVIGLIAGCRVYERQSLELQSHARAWGLRNIEAEPVREYARRLAVHEAEGPGTFDPTDGLSLMEAGAVALHFNPELRVARARAQVPLARAREAGWWPDPQLEAEVLRFVNRGQNTRFRFDGPAINGINASGPETSPLGLRRVEGDFIDDPWIVGASLSITVPLSGRLAVEQDLAWAEYGAAWHRIVIAEWELLQSLRAKWLEWSATHQRLELLKSYLAQLVQIDETARRLVSIGELQPTNARLLSIEVVHHRVTLQELDARAEEQRLGLLAVMGLAPEAPVTLVPQTSVSPAHLSADRRRDAVLDNHPRVLAARAEYEAAEQRLRLEIRRQYPDLTLGPSYSFEEGFSRMGLGFGFPIPLWNRNRQAIAEAFAQREAARVRAEAAVEVALSELAHAEARLSAARARRVMLTNEVAPLADRQVVETRKLLELGEIDVLVLRVSLTNSLETKLQMVDATLAEALAADALHHLVAPHWGVQPRTKEKEDDR